MFTLHVCEWHQVRTKLGNAIMWRNCINGTVDDVDTRLSELNHADEEADRRKMVHCLERDWRSIHAGQFAAYMRERRG